MYLLCNIHKQKPKQKSLDNVRRHKMYMSKTVVRDKGIPLKRIYLQLVYTIVYTSAHGTIYCYVLCGTIYYSVFMELYTIMFYEFQV